MKLATTSLVCAVALAGTAQAADNLVLSGMEWSRFGTYSYVGTLDAIGTGSLADGWVLRQWIDRVTYEYRGASSQIHAEGYGYSPAFGRHVILGSSHVGLYGALRIAQTSLSPDDPSNKDRGARGRVSLQTDAFTPLGRFTENQFLAQAEFGNGGYFVRDRLVIRGPGQYNLGPEVVLKGNSEYAARQFGLTFGGLTWGRRVTFTLRGGLSDQRGQATVGYGSLELTLNR